jgi:hypothetical protein
MKGSDWIRVARDERMYADDFGCKNRFREKAGEDALAVVQAKLAEQTGIHSIRILESVDRAAPGAATYARVINVIHMTILWAFVAARS